LRPLNYEEGRKFRMGEVQVGVTSWVGKKLYHGFDSSGYFDKKSYDESYNLKKRGSNSFFWATPYLALAKAFDGKAGNGVVECFLNVKRALTLNLDALSWVNAIWVRKVLSTAKIDVKWLKDSKNPLEKAAYRGLMGTEGSDNGSRPFLVAGKMQVFNFIDYIGPLLKQAGYDGICLPEKGVPTIACLDFSQVTYGKKVRTGKKTGSWEDYDDYEDKTGEGVGLWDDYDASPVEGLGVVLSPLQVKKGAHLNSKEQSSTTDGPDPRFKEGELFASWRRKGVEVTPLFSGQRRGRISNRFIRSSPDNESWGLYDVGLEAKLEVFCQSLRLRLVAEFGVEVSVSLEKEFLRLNSNVLYVVGVTFGGQTLKVIRLVGEKTNFDYQVSIFGVKVEGFVRSGFFSNALVTRVLNGLRELLGGA
jgi:hypothetical protein